MSERVPERGLIEGYYGTPWNEEARRAVIAFLARHGSRFFIHAPKADEFLRRRWREPYPDEARAMLLRLSAHCRGQGVRFGVGLSPYEAYRDFGSDTKAALAARLSLFREVGAAQIAILFDDMRGDVPDLARRQTEIVNWVAAEASAQRIAFCPTYYSDDPVLDRVFGQRPADYLEELGRLLDPAIDIFWTGEEVCAKEISAGHLARVEAQLGRKPLLWDNYPVNDGPRMSNYLHLRAFTGRHAGIGAHLAGHAINPALQPTLSLIPALTLAEAYAQGDAYEYGAAFARAAEAVLGPGLAKLVQGDLIAFQDLGLDRLEARAEKLRARYAAIDHPGAREIVDWLDGRYRFTGEMM